ITLRFRFLPRRPFGLQSFNCRFLFFGRASGIEQRKAHAVCLDAIDIDLWFVSDVGQNLIPARILVDFRRNLALSWSAHGPFASQVFRHGGIAFFIIFRFNRGSPRSIGPNSASALSTLNSRVRTSRAGSVSDGLVARTVLRFRLVLEI